MTAPRQRGRLAQAADIAIVIGSGVVLVQVALEQRARRRLIRRAATLLEAHKTYAALESAFLNPEAIRANGEAMRRMIQVVAGAQPSPQPAPGPVGEQGQ